MDKTNIECFEIINFKIDILKVSRTVAISHKHVGPCASAPRTDTPPAPARFRWNDKLKKLLEGAAAAAVDAGFASSLVLSTSTLRLQAVRRARGAARSERRQIRSE